MIGNEDEVKQPDNDFLSKLNSKAESVNPSEPVKRPRGRQPGFSPKKAKEEAEKQANTPPPRVENKEFASLIMVTANAFIKEEKIKLTEAEALSLSAPYYQLYTFYLPMMGGISGVWVDALIVTSAIFISKYKTAKEIMDNERRKKDSSDLGDSGNGQVNESKGIIDITAKGAGL